MARGEHELPPDRAWLSAREEERAAGLRFTKRRAEYLLRRWVCKHTVAEALGLPVGVRSLARGEGTNRPSGAPLVRLDEELVELEVSLTDRAGWAVCVLGPAGNPLGCDLELVEPRTAGFVSDFLTEEEQAYVASRPSADRDAAANLVWSAKESALKVLRLGLREDTRNVEVVLGAGDVASSSGWAALEVRAAAGSTMRGWWRREGVFVVTVLAERAVPQPEALTGSADLATARPLHSWLHRPLSPGAP
jgi:4'-phosphopantetheinyl transferase